MTESVAGAHATRTTSERRAYVYLGALLLVAGGVLAWLLLRGGEGSAKLPPVGSGPAAVSETQLEALANAVHHPVYWAGPKAGTYELTRTTDGRIYIRYLPGSGSVGDRAPRYLTIGTYPTKTAYIGITRAARRKGAMSLKLDNGGLMVVNDAMPKSVYFAYPKQPYQVEVFDPSPQRARALVLGGEIKPVR